MKGAHSSKLSCANVFTQTFYLKDYLNQAKMGRNSRICEEGSSCSDITLSDKGNIVKYEIISYRFVRRHGDCIFTDSLHGFAEYVGYTDKRSAECRCCNTKENVIALLDA